MNKEKNSWMILSLTLFVLGMAIGRMADNGVLYFYITIATLCIIILCLSRIMDKNKVDDTDVEVDE